MEQQTWITRKHLDHQSLCYVQANTQEQANQHSHQPNLNPVHERSLKDTKVEDKTKRAIGKF